MPTLSRSSVRRQRWQVAARLNPQSLPINSFLNWFIPAGVNNTVGSSLGTKESLSTILCFLALKKTKNFSLKISAVIIMKIKGTVLFFNHIKRRKNRTVPFIYNPLTMSLTTSGEKPRRIRYAYTRAFALSGSMFFNLENLCSANCLAILSSL